MSNINSNVDSASETRIEAPSDLPVVIIIRDFRATPAQLHRAHTDADLYAKWVGPAGMPTRIDHWDARTGGSYRYATLDPNTPDETGAPAEYSFHGSFHDVTDDRIVQTFTFDGMPEGVSLETLTFEDLGDGRTRLHARSLLDSFASRDAMLASGMEVGINDGYSKLDRLLESGDL